MIDEELKFLRWFYQNADFGPADGDVRNHLKTCYRMETGNELPKGYEQSD